MNVLHISAECYPIAKVGGLADVVGSLPKYQQKIGVNSNVVMPYYDTVFSQNNSFKSIYKNSLLLGETIFNFKILKLENSTLGFDLFCVDVRELLFKDYVYSSDDTERFLAFQIATLDWILSLKQKPNLIHTHDHHTGLIPFMMSQSFKYESLKNIPTVISIHNAQYQGWFSHDKSHLIPSFNPENTGLLDWDGAINSLAAGVKCAWSVTTVSPSYMEELKQKANGLESLFNHESTKCLGILNGIDWNVWNPESDPYLHKNYSKTSVISGKRVSKKWLCNEFDLDVSKPLFTFIGRLVHEKGADLFPAVFEKALKENDISILLLGSGDKETEAQLGTLKSLKNFNAFIGYDEKLSHLIYAGADFLLMPSRVEPCGLNQMYALRYGTIPVVNAIGGLKDTVIDVDNKGFGICHDGVTVEKIVHAIERANALYLDQKKYRLTSKKLMSIDHSWDLSAQEYVKLYQSLIL